MTPQGGADVPHLRAQSPKSNAVFNPPTREWGLSAFELFKDQITMVFKTALQRLESGRQIYARSFQIKKSHPLEWDGGFSGKSLRDHNSITYVHSNKTTVKGTVVERA